MLSKWNISCILVSIIGAILCIGSYSSSYYRNDSGTDYTGYAISHFFFYLGIALFFCGIYAIVKYIYDKRTNRGITVASLEAPRTVVTTVTVVKTVMPADSDSD